MSGQQVVCHSRCRAGHPQSAAPLQVWRSLRSLATLRSLRCRSSRKRSRGAAGAESEPEVSGDDVAATFEGFQGVAFGLVSWGGWTCLHMGPM